MKRIKYSGINLPKKQKTYIYKTINTDERNQRQHKEVEKYTMFMDWKDQYSENEYTTQRNL